MAEKSIKVKVYKKNKFEKIRDYLELNFKCSEFSIGFWWVFRTRSEYKFNVCVAKAAKMIEEDCIERCPCCYRKKSNPLIGTLVF